MRRIIIFLLIVISLTLTPTAGGSSPQLFTDRQSELLDIFNSAEQTIRRDGNYSRALEQYLAFIRGAEGDAKLERQLLTAYISVAVIYGSFNDTDNAITYNKQAYPLAKKLGNREFTELALTNLGQSYKDKRNFIPLLHNKRGNGPSAESPFRRSAPLQECRQHRPPRKSESLRTVCSAVAHSRALPDSRQT